MDNHTTKYVFKYYGYGKSSLWVYRNGSLLQTISIDNTYDAVYWCNRHNMSVREIVTADDGKRYAIWTNPDTDSICALPVHNEEAYREVES